eukprot:4782992-Ditylum_brightwellii.AAC.1
MKERVFVSIDLIAFDRTLDWRAWYVCLVWDKGNGKDCLETHPHYLYPMLVISSVWKLKSEVRCLNFLCDDATFGSSLMHKKQSTKDATNDVMFVSSPT